MSFIPPPLGGRGAQDIAAAIPNAELYLVPGAGHMRPQDFPEVLNPKMLEFLARTTQVILQE